MYLYYSNDSMPIHVAYIFFFTDTATTEIYTLSLHDALPIYRGDCHETATRVDYANGRCGQRIAELILDRKSTRLNSSHGSISYAVFCLKKKNARHISF